MKTFNTLVAALGLASLCATAHASGALTLTPASTSTTAGSSFSVQVRGAGFTDNVVGGGFSLAFDPGVLRLDSVLVNSSVWDFLNSPGSIDNTAGTLTNTYFNSFTNLPTGNFAIATLSFTAMAGGSSTLSLNASADFPFASDLAEVINVSYGGALVNVTAVPEPDSWASLALGLALLPVLRRLRRA